MTCGTLLPEHSQRAEQADQPNETNERVDQDLNHRSAPRSEEPEIVRAITSNENGYWLGAGMPDGVRYQPPI